MNFNSVDEMRRYAERAAMIEAARATYERVTVALSSLAGALYSGGRIAILLPTPQPQASPPVVPNLGVLEETAKELEAVATLLRAAEADLLEFRKVSIVAAVTGT